jgi:hypothetical protein
MNVLYHLLANIISNSIDLWTLLGVVNNTQYYQS